MPPVPAPKHTNPVSHSADVQQGFVQSGPSACVTVGVSMALVPQSLLAQSPSTRHGVPTFAGPASWSARASRTADASASGRSAVSSSPASAAPTHCPVARSHALPGGHAEGSALAHVNAGGALPMIAWQPNTARATNAAEAAA